MSKAATSVAGYATISNYAANLKRKACAALVLCVVCAVLAGLVLAMVPQRAYADSPTYSMAVVGNDAPDSIAPGDTFTLSLTLENNESSQYTMYAMSATIRYNTSMLEVISLNTNNGIDVYTRDAGDGFTDAVLNFKASTLKGVTWDNGTSLMDVTFKAVNEGSTSMSIRRANISNSTGMGRYACTCSDALITVSSAGSSSSVPAIEPSSDASEGTTEGIDAPEADPATLEGDTSDTMTEEEKAEYEATKSGELAASTSASDATSGAADSASLSKDGKTAGDEQGMPTVLLVLICALAVVVIALIAAIIIHKRKTAQSDAVDAFANQNGANVQASGANGTNASAKAFSADAPTEVI